MANGIYRLVLVVKSRRLTALIFRVIPRHEGVGVGVRDKGWGRVVILSFHRLWRIERVLHMIFSSAPIDLRNARERELATLDEKLTSSGIAELHAR